MFIAVCFSATAIATPKVMRYCADQYPPYQIFQKGKTVTGSYIELMRAIANKLHANLSVTQDIPFKRCLKHLKEGSADVVAGLVWTEERSQYLHLIKYRDSTEFVFLVVQKFSRQVTQFEDLSGLRVGVVEGNLNYPRFDREQSLFVKVPGKSLLSNLRRLKAGRVDAVVATSVEAQYLINSYPDIGAELKYLDYRGDNNLPGYIGISRNSPWAHHLDKISIVIEKMRSDGDAVRIIDEFIKAFKPSVDP